MVAHCRSHELLHPWGESATHPIEPPWRVPAAIATSAPDWGEHTNEMLREVGYDDQDIAELRAKGVV